MMNNYIECGLYSNKVFENRENDFADMSKSNEEKENELYVRFYIHIETQEVKGIWWMPWR